MTITSVGSCTKSSPDYGKLACLDGWPPLPPAAALAAPLAIAPSILWQTNLGSVALPQKPGVALSADHVVASGGASWIALDRKTGTQLFVQTTGPDPSNYSLGAPVVDPTGVVYAESSVALYAFRADGPKQWSWASPSQALSSEPVQGSLVPSIVGANQILAPSFSQEHALLPSGAYLWSTGLVALLTVGHWGLGFDATASFVSDLRTGKPAGRLRAADGHDVVVLVPMAGRGILAVDRDNSSGLHFLLLDTCGSQVWSVDVGNSKVCVLPEYTIVGSGEVAYVPFDACGSAAPNPQMVAIGPAGNILAGPVPMPQLPLAAGADGTIYVADIHVPKPTASVVALSPDLREAWRLDLPGTIAYDATAIMSDDGVIYVQFSGATENAIAAVQTTSPGPAPSSWPMLRHDSRSSNWAGGQF